MIADLGVLRLFFAKASAMTIASVSTRLSLHAAPVMGAIGRRREKLRGCARTLPRFALGPRPGLLFGGKAFLLKGLKLEELVRERIVPGYFHGGCPAPFKTTPAASRKSRGRFNPSTRP